jgi:signal transduction histidine kinase
MELGVMLYHVAKELLQNIVKHSGARSASIRIVKDEKAIRAIVADNGRGFDISDLDSPGHEGGFGLFSIRERVKSFHGSVQIESAPGKGTQVTVELPAVSKSEKETGNKEKAAPKRRKRRK